MTYQPGSKSQSETLDFETAAATAVDRRNRDDKSSLDNYKSSSGKTLNQQLPEVCPLVFPELEKAGGEQQENAFKRSLAFTRHYYDRRSQAEFAAHNPGSKLNVKDHEFATKYGHPTTFENSGLIGVMTGGKVDPRRKRWESRNRRREAFGKKPIPSGQQGLLGKPGLVKRTLGDNILYLMIVNMPSDEELKAAKEAEERFTKEQPNWFEKLIAADS